MFRNNQYLVNSCLFQYSQLQDHLAKREGRLFFAGEHTDFPHAWMDTAIKSGARAASELHLDEDWTQNRGYIYNKKMKVTPIMGRQRYGKDFKDTAKDVHEDEGEDAESRTLEQEHVDGEQVEDVDDKKEELRKLKIDLVKSFEGGIKTKVDNLINGGMELGNWLGIG